MILLDLNMPRKDGREALAEIKSHPVLRRIPVIVLTTNQAEEDVVRTYNLGVNCFITKPITFNSLMEVTRRLGKYWYEHVALHRALESVTRTVHKIIKILMMDDTETHYYLNGKRLKKKKG